MKQSLPFLLAIGLLMIVVPPLLAHTELLTAVPAPGDTLTTSPKELRLTFNQQLQSGSDLFLFGEGFNYVDDLLVEIGSSGDQLIAQLPELAPDSYTVQWTAVSEDGHAVNGSYTFQIEPAQSNNLNTRWIVIFVAIAIILLAIVIFSRKSSHRVT